MLKHAMLMYSTRFDDVMISAVELEIDIRTIMFCTLNTPKIDMRSLLCGLVVYNDFIFVHVQGSPREVWYTGWVGG